MDPHFVQHLRYKLQKRVARLNSVATTESFLVLLKQFWLFFDRQPTFLAIIEQLSHAFPSIDEQAADIISGASAVYGDSEEKAAALGYQVLRKLVDAGPNTLINIGFRYGRSAQGTETLEAIRETFLEPFYEYLDEQLDDQRAVLALLLRYKRRCEWFHAARLFDLTQEDKSRSAESNLALDLYAYLHDQGIDFNIETGSIRGSIDLIAAQHTDDPLLLDTKIFDADNRSKPYICKGFGQIYTYTQQFNEPFGYLVIYNISDRDLRFALSQVARVPVVVHNHKTIFLMTIDIHPHAKPVSQRDPLKAIEITEEDLIQIIGDSEA